MNLFAFISVFCSIQILCLIIGRRASRNLKGKEDYFLSGKGVKFFPLMMTFLATQVGGGTILGSAQEAFQFGWAVLLYPLGASIGMILLGLGIGQRLAGFKVSTVAEILEVVYRSSSLKKIASILSMISLFMILTAQIIASQKFLISLGLTSTPLFLVFWGFVIFYTVQGGLKAVIATDIFQTLFFIGVFLACLAFALFTPHFSFFQFTEVEPFQFPSSKLYGWLFMPLLFMLIEQDMGQRCFAGSSPKTVGRASLVAGLATFSICLIPVLFGMGAQILGLNIPDGASVFMTAVSAISPPWIATLVGCAVLTAVLSTADSLINAIGSNLSNDFKLPLFQGRRGLRSARMTSALIAVGALFFSFAFNNVVDVMIQSYALSVSALFVPIFVALFKRKGNFLSALLAMIFGTFGFALFLVYPLPFPKELASLLLSFLAFSLGEAIAWYKSKKGIINWS
ncbi:MAG: sodium:solute symporter family protein [Chlamydiales bacterium]